jgi:hypothetical protein
MKSKEYKLLIEAINNAELPGYCRYEGDEGQPLCFIAQLGALYDIEPNEWFEGASIIANSNTELVEGIPYDFDLLHRLQEAWDEGSAGEIDEEERKSNMINMVDDHYATAAEIASKTHPYSDYHRTSLEQSLGDE